MARRCKHTQAVGPISSRVPSPYQKLQARKKVALLDRLQRLQIRIISSKQLIDWWTDFERTEQ